jgi:hypothetical protein
LFILSQSVVLEHDLALPKQNLSHTSIVNDATRLYDDVDVVFFGVFIGHFGVVKPAR